MRRLYATQDNFTIIGVFNENGKFEHFFVGDMQEEKLSNRTFEKASDAIDYGYELTESKRLLND